MWGYSKTLGGNRNLGKIDIQLNSFWKINGVGVIGILLGIVIAFYFYEKGHKYREPIFLVDPVRTPIISSSTASQAPLIILKSDSTPIKADVTSIRFYFWNRGNEPIKSQNVLSHVNI